LRSSAGRRSRGRSRRARSQSRCRLSAFSTPNVTFIFDAFVEGMRDLGYVEGRNVAYVRKVLHGNFAVLPALAAELVDQKVDVVVTLSPPLIHAVERASNAMPIVILASADPVLAGFVKSYAHPGGNITGLSFVDEELAAKRLDLLRELVPNLRDVACSGGANRPARDLRPRARPDKRWACNFTAGNLRTWTRSNPRFSKPPRRRWTGLMRYPIRSSTRTGSGSLNSPRNTGCRRSTNPRTTCARGA
jgi:hypothetical protein